MNAKLNQSKHQWRMISRMIYHSEQEQAKACLECHKHLPLTSFTKNPNMKDGRINTCRECQKIYKAKWRQSKMRQNKMRHSNCGFCNNAIRAKGHGMVNICKICRNKGFSSMDLPMCSIANDWLRIGWSAKGSNLGVAHKGAEGRLQSQT